MTDAMPGSWAKVAAAPPAAAHSDATFSRIEFTVKQAKTKKNRTNADGGGTVCCKVSHCESTPDHCSDNTCKSRLKKTLTQVEATNLSLTLAFDTRIHDLERLRRDIFDTCTTDDFFCESLEVSRLAVLRAKALKPKQVDCLCTMCELVKARQETKIIHERLAAAQDRLAALREYHVVHDKERLKRFDIGQGKSKYFTPVGSRGAKGVVALRPTLQMQSSYNMAALTTNNMKIRVLKIGWKDKPKTLPVAETVLKNMDGGTETKKNED